MKKGFFDDEEKEPTGELVEFLNCKQCKLDKTCKSPRMEMSGKGKKGILWIAEAPGKVEDDEGTQLVGDSGQLFREYLSRLGIDLDDDCYKTNSLSCRPPGNDTPTDTQIKCCRPRVMKVIEETRPKVIGLLGMPAIKSVIGSKWKKDIGTVGMWRGWTIPDRHFKTWLVPTYHPAYIKRREDAQKGKERDVASVIFERDLRKILELTEKDPSECWEDESSRIVILDEEGAGAYLEQISWVPSEWMTFDYETTGLKPFKKGHEIVCVSICDGILSRAFLITEAIRKPFVGFLQNESKKIASNLKFEEVWSRAFFNTPVNNWGWDTMQNAHILDNRGGEGTSGGHKVFEKGITSIKFQAYIRYGTPDYSAAIEKYLISDEEFGANTFNRIKEAPIKDLLKYCAMDSLLEHRVAMDQMKEMGL